MHPQRWRNANEFKERSHVPRRVPGVRVQFAYCIQLPVVHAIADWHLQLPLHTWEHTGFVDAISGKLSLRVSQNKEPSRALHSDTKGTVICVLDCLKNEVRKGKKKKEEEEEAKKTKEKVGKFSYVPLKELNLQIWELLAFAAFKHQ